MPKAIPSDRPSRWRSRANQRLLAGLLLVASAAASREGLASDAGSDEAAVEQRRAEAKTKYQAGVEAYDKKRYKDAVDFFLSADKLAPSAPLSYNIARAYERLGDDASALRWYRDYLRRNPAAENSTSVRETVTKLAAALAKKGVQQLTIISTPVAATVSIDSQPMGVTPWTGELAPGKHHVMLSFRGYVDAEREVELSPADPLDVAIHLEAKAAEPATVAPSVAAPAAAPPPTAAPPPVAAPAEPRRKKLGVWPWVTLGAGAAALGGSLAFEIMRRSAENDAEEATTQIGFKEAIDTMESRETTARVLLGVGGAVVIAGGVMLLLDSGGSSGTSVGLGCLPAGCAVRAGGRF